MLKPRFHAEQCGPRKWTVYDRIHHDCIGQKLGLFRSKKEAQKFAHKLGCECRYTKVT